MSNISFHLIKPKGSIYTHTHTKKNKGIQNGRSCRTYFIYLFWHGKKTIFRSKEILASVEYG